MMIKVFGDAVTSVSTKKYNGTDYYFCWYSGKMILMKIPDFEDSKHWIMVPKFGLQEQIPWPLWAADALIFLLKKMVEIMNNIPDGRKGALIYHCRGIVRFLRKQEWSRTAAWWKNALAQWNKMMKIIVLFDRAGKKLFLEYYFLRNSQITFGILW